MCSFTSLGQVLFVILSLSLSLSSAFILDGVQAAAAAAAAPDSVHCWTCSSDTIIQDALCTDEHWTGAVSANVQKIDCATAIAPSLPIVEKSAPITTCRKSVSKLDGKVVGTVRSCGIPGAAAAGLSSANQTECVRGDRSQTNTDDEICVCKGDYCNGSSSGSIKIVASASTGTGLLMAALLICEKLTIFA